MSIGQKIIHLESVDSTNNYAAKLLSEGRIGHGTVILAEGRGGLNGHLRLVKTYYLVSFCNPTICQCLNSAY